MEEDSITAETTLADDLGADSLDVVDLLMSIEDEFEVEIPDEEVENIKTVGALGSTSRATLRCKNFSISQENAELCASSLGPGAFFCKTALSI